MQYNLVFSTDINYLTYLFVLCQSIIDHIEDNPTNLQDEIVFNVLIDESVDIESVKEKALNFSERNNDCSISFRFEWLFVDLNIFNKFNSMYRNGKESFSTYYRFIIDKILPETVDYAAYLDIDMLVLTDIRKLFKQHNLEGKVLGAVLDPGICNEAKPFIESRHKTDPAKIIQIPKTHYFNAGLLLLNLKEWRKQNIGGQALELASQYDLVLHDQDALNFICKDKILLLDFEWNFQTSMFYVLYNPDTNKYDIVSALTQDKHWDVEAPSVEKFEKAALSPCIIHFNGSQPWTIENYHNVPFVTRVPSSPKLVFYKEQWFLTRLKVVEFPEIHLINYNALDEHDIKLVQLETKVSKKIKKQEKSLIFISVFLFILNMFTLILLLFR